MKPSASSKAGRRRVQVAVAFERAEQLLRDLQRKCKHTEIRSNGGSPPSFVCVDCGKVDHCKWSGFTLNRSKQDMFSEKCPRISDAEFNRLRL